MSTCRRRGSPSTRVACSIELDLTPGIALAEAIIADIDRNRDGSLSPDEQRAYREPGVPRADARSRRDAGLRARLGASSFPDVEAMRRGEGTIRLQSAATLPRLSSGPHQLLFRNSHHPDRSVYLANALVPESDEVAVTAQRRDRDQTRADDRLCSAAGARNSHAGLAAGQHRWHRRAVRAGDATAEIGIRGRRG